MSSSHQGYLIAVAALGFALCEILLAEDQHPTVSNRIAAARSGALALQSDGSTIASSGSKDTRVRLSSAQTAEVQQHIETAKETATELQEIEEIASPPQRALISRITPLLHDLVRNAEAMLDHVKTSQKKAQRQVDADYLSAHEEIAKHIATEIVAAIDLVEQNIPAERPNKEAHNGTAANPAPIVARREILSLQRSTRCREAER